MRNNFILIVLSFAWAMPTFSTPIEAKIGWYAITCGMSHFGKTETSAKAECKKKQNIKSNICGCSHADIIEIKKDQKPSLYSLGAAERTRVAAVRNCEKKHSAWIAGLPKGSNYPGANCHLSEVQPLYGPYKRMPTRRQFDDANGFPYIGFDSEGFGEWYSEEGMATCFTGDTQILTTLGNRAIKSISIGDAAIT